MYFAAVQQCLDANPQAMRQRRETAEHPFGKSTLPRGDAVPGCSSTQRVGTRVKLLTEYLE